MKLLPFRMMVIMVTFILLWFAIIKLTGIPFYILPSPFEVAKSISTNYSLLVSHSLVTLFEILMGLALGITFGAITAIILSMSKMMRYWVLPILVVSQTLPVFAIAPILVLWLGYDMASKIAMATLIIYFPVTVSLLDGLHNINQDYIDLAKTMDARPMAILQYLRIPNSLPSFTSGIKVATSVAPIGAIVGEWVGSSEGLGYLMLHANGRMQTDLMFAALFVLSILALTIFFSISRIMDFILLKYSVPTKL